MGQKQRNTLTIRVPEELKDRIETIAAQQGVSINQFALYAFTKELGEIESGNSLRDLRASIDKKQMFARIDDLLGKVPSRSVEAWDRPMSETDAG
ncbi:MAG: toxin-antitoxin system HicB family antitoxin [Spirochaeta sp.]|nr:toxin-antitoxin system HicB family antitoxin [Spirochaeta sp.]